MTVPTLHFTKNLLIHSSKFSNSIQMKFEPDSNSLLKTYSKPIQKFWNFAITFVLHQYLTTKNIINSKNAQSHLAFDQTPSICTVHTCKKIQKIGRHLAAAPLLLLSSPSPLLLLFNASGPAATMEQGRQRARGTRAQERRSIGTMGKGGSLRGGRRWQESGDEDGGLGAARGDGDGDGDGDGAGRGGGVTGTVTVSVSKPVDLG